MATWQPAPEPQPAISAEVCLAAVAFIAGSVAAATTGDVASGEGPATSLALLGGWPLCALAGAVVLDRAPGHPVGRVLAALGLVPIAVLLWALPGPTDLLTPWRLEDPVRRLGGLMAVLVGIGLPWAMRGSLPRGALVAGGVALAGGSVVAAGFSIGWPAVAGGTATAYALLLRTTAAEPRDERRRTAWELITLTAAGTGVAVGWWAGPDTAAVITCLALAVVGVVSARLVFASAFRPLAEHLVDLALVVTVVAGAAAVGLLTWWASSVAAAPEPRSSGAFSALVVLGVGAVSARWLRRGWIARRYGDGSLSAHDVAIITADLHRQADPRELLDKAARMVAGASGCGSARLVLGEADPVEGWTSHPLHVGGDLIGTLQVRVDGPDGLEPRQERVVGQLLPTVALVARAVGLAVEADHARRDVTRHRDAERTRILGDLHDGLGPVLAGMSMRVQAALRTAADPAYASLLGGLADDLARSRADLRRLVAGISPSALEGGDLGEALRLLVRSFEGGDGPRVALSVELVDALSPEVQVTLYRVVAEGLTNALRHAAPAHITVCVRTDPGVVVAEVVDDGRGGPVVPGVGLTSLRQRAEALGGCLSVAPAPGGGTALRLVLGPT